MAQQDIDIIEEDNKEPGDNDEGTQTSLGDDKYSEYVFTFKPLDSLVIIVKSKKSRRLFMGKFSKQELISMKLTQSIKEIISMIEMARKGVKQKINCQFKIAFSSAEETVNADQMSDTFNRGDALYLIVSIKEIWLNCDYLFKLEEQERNEIDILREIIEDLQAKMDENELKLKEMVEASIKPKRNPSIVFKCNTPATTVPWNLIHIASVLEGMVTREDSNASIVIGIAGRYKISARFGLNNDWGSTLTHDLKLNGTTIAHSRTYHSHSNTFNEERIFNVGDKLTYVLNSTVSNGYWDPNCNHFSLEYLGQE